METKLLNINQITEDKELYPRYQYSWFQVNKYAKAMQAGAVFPPVTIALFAGKYYLIDGKHRVEAYKTNKQSEVQCEVLHAKSRAEIFSEAVKRNVEHGLSLSTQETANAIQRLRLMDFSDAQISRIVSIPLEKINSFVVNRVTSSLTGESIVLKAPLKHLAGESISSDAEGTMQVYASRSQLQLAEELLTLLEVGVINTKNLVLMNKLKQIRRLIEALILEQKGK